MTTTYEDMKAEVYGSIKEAVEREDYITLNRLANAFAQSDDMETAEWLKGLAKDAEDACWAYDRATDEALIDSYKN